MSIAGFAFSPQHKNAVQLLVSSQNRQIRMAELRRFIFSATLIVVAGFAAHRVFGVSADPFSGLVLITLAQVNWREYRSRRRQFRAAVAELRAFQKEERWRLVEEIDGEADRHAFTQAL